MADAKGLAVTPQQLSQFQQVSFDCIELKIEAYDSLQQEDQVRSLVEDQLEIVRQSNGEKSFSYATMLYQVANYYKGRRNLSRAKSKLQEAKILASILSDDYKKLKISIEIGQ